MSQLHPISGCDNPTRKADVVFIHGLGGDAFTTWRYGDDNASSWPHWLGHEFKDVGVWSLGYAASPSKWPRILRVFGFGNQDSGHSMTLPDRAGQVLDRMVNKGLGNNPILFVCHSLGGLLAKEIIRKSADSVDEPKRRMASSTRAVLFLATPHHGAVLATLADAFSTIFATTVSMEDLREHDARLRDLYDWYRNHSPRFGIRTVTYFEERSVMGVARIVNPDSAHPGVGADPIALDEDHISISKPRNPDDQVCDAARALLKDHVLFAPLPPAAKPNLVPVPTQDSPQHRVPRELPHAANQFFGRLTEKKQLVERLRAGKSTAVSGAAGLGKTALAAAALEEVVGHRAANLSESPFHDGLIFLDLYKFHGLAGPAWNALANSLEGPTYLESRPERERATEACRNRRILVILEGAEEANGAEGRTTFPELSSVLAPENRWLLLTRRTNQCEPAETVYLNDALRPDDAAALLDSLTKSRPPNPGVRSAVLDLLKGHPLAIHWAAGVLSAPEEDAASLADDWKSDALLRLSDPKKAEHTLEWLFNRSIRGLDDAARQALSAAGLLANAPFPTSAIEAALGAAAERPLKSLVQRGMLRRFDGGRWQCVHILAYRFARRDSGANSDPRQRLAAWLSAQLKTALQPQSNVPPLGAVAEWLDHADALLRTDLNQQLWLPLANYLLYDARDRFLEMGSLGLTNRALGAVSSWLNQIPAPKSQEPYWLRERSVSQERIGDILSAQGDLSGALAVYRDTLAVAQRLAQADPSNATSQRDLSVSQNKIGDILRAQGDLSGALAAYRDSLAVAQRLAQADPSNATSQRDLSYNFTLLAQTLDKLGDRKQALHYAEQSQVIDERLSALDPSNATWRNDVIVSRNLVAGLRARQ